jgi:acetyl-CoA carboxylase biotin carboxyl carrier protein
VIAGFGPPGYLYALDALARWLAGGGRMMPKSFSPDPDVIRKLAEILDQTGLGEIEYAEGDRRIRVAKPNGACRPGPTSPRPRPPCRSPRRRPSRRPSVNAVLSPMVGTAYLAPEPAPPSSSRSATKVVEGQTLLIIEAMKVMNPIKSPRAGTVSAVLIENAAPVEYGEPLLVVD